MKDRIKIVKKVRRVDKPPYIIDESRLKRFPRENMIFGRVKWEGYHQKHNKKISSLIIEGKPGYSRIDFALAYASWIVHDAFEDGFSRKRIKQFRTPTAMKKLDWTKTKCKIEDARKMSTYIKRAARLFGASLVGVCKLNRKWLYAKVKLPRKFENVIVMAVEMDANGIATSPTAIAAAATGVGYSKMAFVLACMGEFIRNLGYEAIQCGNDTALSIPLAIDAGLGELGRNGLLITPEYGPRVRLCKILTDLPLEPDKPIEFGVREFCRTCKLCAKYCEAKAISMDNEPSFNGVCKSNNPGALKWYVDAERCYLYWQKNGTDCSTCIKVCPYNISTSGKHKLSPEEFWKENL